MKSNIKTKNLKEPITDDERNKLIKDTEERVKNELKKKWKISNFL